MRIALALSENRPLSTYPSFVNSIFLLQQEGHKVDIYLNCRMQVDVPLLSVDIIRFDSTFWGAFRTFLKEFSEKKYNYVFFYREIELIAGGLVCFLMRLPYVYFSLEIRSYDEYQRRDIIGRWMKTLEILMNRKSVLTVVQDENRKALAMKVQGLSEAKISIVPNSYFRTNDTKSNFIREHFGIANDKVIVLYPGALEAWALGAGLLTEVAFWDEKFVLVLHGFSRDCYIDALRKQAAAINAQSPGRILFSTEILNEEDYLDFVASADIGLVWYKKDLSENVRTVGKSSGKFSAFMASGVPVVAPSYLKSLSEVVQQYRCGLSVDDEVGVGPALKQLLTSIDEYAKNAAVCFNEELDFRRFFQAFLSKLPVR